MDNAQNIDIGPHDWQAFCALADLEKEAFGDEALTPQQLVLLGRSGIIFLWRQNREILGECIVLPTMAPGGYFLISLAIKSSHQRHGIGKKLMQEVLHWVMDKPIDSSTSSTQAFLELTVDPENQAALSLYLDHFEFQKIQLVHDYFGPGKDRWILKKFFASDSLHL